MDTVYYALDKPDSLDGQQGLRKHTKKSRKAVAEFLSKQDAYTLHRPTVRRFPRRRTFSKGINDMFQCDLLDISSLARYNDGNRYLLMCIDVFSKYGRIAPLRPRMPFLCVMHLQRF